MFTRFGRVAVVALPGLLASALAQQAAANIYQWEWVDPGDPSQGIRQSSKPCPEGLGVSARPNADLSWRDLTQAYLMGANLTGANLWGATLTNGNLNGGSLTEAVFYEAKLTNASLAGANLTRARFMRATLSKANLVGANLTGADFEGASLTSANLGGASIVGASFLEARLTNASLTGANLTGADFWGATLTDADFTDAQVAQAKLRATTSGGFAAAQLYSTASYKARDLHGIILDANDLTGWNFANQNLTGAGFGGTTLANASLTGANLTGANLCWATLTSADFTDAQVAKAYIFGTTGFTAAQLYSTASYKARDLHGIGLRWNDLTGWNLASQNLTGADFEDATLTNADLSFADLRGAMDLNTAGVGSLRNTIMPDGTIQPLALAAGETLIAYEYDGNIPISVSGSMTIDPLARLDLTNNSMIVRADGTDRDALLAQITALLASGRKSAPLLWQGTGIVSSTAAADAKQFHGLGVMLNADSQGKAIYDTFAGQGVDANAILIKYTYNGDANLDGAVNADDYFLADSGYITQKGGWYNGDFNYDGVVNADDYFQIDSAFIGQTATLSNASRLTHHASPIPEPSSLLWAVGTLALLRRRRGT
ncbi:MAG: pentapeptide repeat-containing protein [Planctomycetota bacterium]|nr:pentapeptide repeat-containing protein [Planctomycetota bacterium]